MVSRFWLEFCPPLFSIRKCHEFYCFLENSFSLFYVLPFVYLRLETILLWSPGWPETHHVVASVSQVLDLQIGESVPIRSYHEQLLKEHFFLSWNLSLFHLCEGGLPWLSIYSFLHCLVWCFIPPISLWIQFLMSAFSVMSLWATHWMETSQEQKPYLLFIAISPGLRKIAGI